MVEEIAPTPNPLAQKKTGYTDIYPVPERQFVPTGVADHREQRTDDAAVNGEPAGCQVQHAPRVSGEAFPLERNIVDARPGDAQQQAEHKLVPDVVGVVGAVFGAAGAEIGGEERPRHNDRAVPADTFEAEEAEADEEWVVRRVKSHKRYSAAA